MTFHARPFICQSVPPHAAPSLCCGRLPPVFTFSFCVFALICGFPSRGPVDKIMPVLRSCLAPFSRKGRCALPFSLNLTLLFCHPRSMDSGARHSKLYAFSRFFYHPRVLCPPKFLRYFCGATTFSVPNFFQPDGWPVASCPSLAFFLFRPTYPQTICYFTLVILSQGRNPFVPRWTPPHSRTPSRRSFFAQCRSPAALSLFFLRLLVKSPYCQPSLSASTLPGPRPLRAFLSHEPGPRHNSLHGLSPALPAPKIGDPLGACPILYKCPSWSAVWSGCQCIFPRA